SSHRFSWFNCKVEKTSLKALLKMPLLMYYLNKITHYLYAEVNKMPQLTPLLADVSASVTELKKDPMGIIRNGLGETVVILNRNEPAFYAVPPAQYELMMQLIDDMYLVDL